MTGNHDDELDAIDLSMIVMIIMNFNSYASLARYFFNSFCFVLLFFPFFYTKLYIRDKCKLYFIFIAVSKLSVKTFKTRTAHFVFSLRIFLSAQVVITSITALDMFKNFCLVLRLLFADSLVPKFNFNKRKKAREKSGKW